MPKSLDFNEFSPATYSEWKKNVLKELGQKSFEDLIWTPEEGLSIGPYYVAGAAKAWADGSKRVSGTWEMRQDFKGDNLGESNRLILTALNGGVDSIGIQSSIQSRGDLDAVLDLVLCDLISVNFNCSDNSLNVLKWYIEKAISNGADTRNLRGSLNARLSVRDINVSTLLPLAELSGKHLGLFRVFTVNAADIHNNGGTAAQELAYALAFGNELLHVLTGVGVSIDDAAAMIQFNLGTGSSYFLQIAKFKTFRKLWSQVVQRYEPVHSCSDYTFLHAETSKLLQTISDPYNNVLRSVTQAMSAAIGGVNSITVNVYDEAFAEQNDTSLRIARNIHHLLIEESYFSQHADAARGSYYVDEIMRQLAESSWKLFVGIESRGGITQCETYFNAEVDRNFSRLQQDTISGKKVVLGVNKYPDKTEFIGNRVDITNAKRLSSALEESRAMSEKNQAVNK